MAGIAGAAAHDTSSYEGVDNAAEFADKVTFGTAVVALFGLNTTLVVVEGMDSTEDQN